MAVEKNRLAIIDWARSARLTIKTIIPAARTIGGTSSDQWNRSMSISVTARLAAAVARIARNAKRSIVGPAGLKRSRNSVGSTDRDTYATHPIMMARKTQ